MDNGKNKPAAVKSPSPQVQAAPPTQPPVPPSSDMTTVPTDILASLSSEKYVKALAEGAENYLIDKGWVREGNQWREPPAKPEGPTVRKIEVKSDDGRSTKVIEQLCIPPLSWAYSTKGAIARQQFMDASTKVA